MTGIETAEPTAAVIELNRKHISPGLRQMLPMMVLGCLLAISAGCGMLNGNAEISTWIGRPMNELVQSRGNPTNWETDGKGNMVLVYEWTWESTYETPGRAWRDASGVRWTNPKMETILHRERRAYYVNREGIVSDGKWSW
ncbi:MAG: hypothetical protein V1766_15825 [Pseudomonadota bacterium]